MIQKVLSILLVVVGFTFAQLVAPKAVVKVIEHNFGDIEQGKIVNYSYFITNTGGDLLKILNVRASCGCTAAKPEKSELKPGESTPILVTFNSAGRSGAQQKYIHVTTNDPSNQEITLKIYGNTITSESIDALKRTPKIYLPESEHNFGKVKEGEKVCHIFNVTNKGKTTLEIKEVKTSCGYTAALISNKNIEPGKDGTIKIDLDTKNRAGRLIRSITILSNDPDEPNKIITISAEVIKAGK